MTATVVVDMGGTSTRLALIHEGVVLARAEPFPTKAVAQDPATRPQRHLDVVAAAVEQLRARTGWPDAPVGVAVGATVSAAGRITNASMLWGVPATGLDLAAELRRRLPGTTVRVANDLNAAMWRYRHLGRFALVTVSTGVAIKVFDDRLPVPYKLLLDDDGLAGESGHVGVGFGRLEPDRPVCACGEIGDLCAHTAGPGLVHAAARIAAEQPELWRSSSLYRDDPRPDHAPDTRAVDTRALAATGTEPFTRAVLRRGTRDLALELLRVMALLGLRRVVVSGGIPRNLGDPWFDALLEGMSEQLPGSAWFTGWTTADLGRALVRSGDDDDALLGMAAWLQAERSLSAGVRTEPGRDRPVLAVSERRPVGFQQFELAVRWAGLCGTDRQIVSGIRGCQPGILGHEAVGTVTAVGERMAGLAPGDVITINPNHPSDPDDKLGHNQPGLLRQYATLSDALVNQGRVMVLPADALQPEWVLVEPLSCVVNSLTQACAGAPDLSGRRVLVAGAGVAGLLHVLAAQLLGAEQVLIANRSAGRLDRVRERGLLEGVDEVTLGPGAVRRIGHLTHGRGPDLVFVAVAGGGAEVLHQLWPALAPAATACLFGGFSPREVIQPWAVDVDRVRRHGQRHAIDRDSRPATIVGASGAGRADVEAAVRLLGDPGEAAKRFPLLVTHLVALDAAPGVLHELAVHGRVAGEVPIKVVVDLNRQDGSVIRT